MKFSLTVYIGSSHLLQSNIGISSFLDDKSLQYQVILCSMCYFILEVPQKKNDNVFIPSVWSMGLVILKADCGRNAPLSNPFRVALRAEPRVK